MTLNRRDFLRHGLFASAGFVLPMTSSIPLAQSDALTGQYRPVHDPCIIKADGTYYLYCTGPKIPMRSSPDLREWALIGDVFDGLPDWATTEVPDTDSYWAPDISFFNDRYHLYYSISTFGSSHSRIGLATNTTLDPAAEDYAWVDQGIVVGSARDTNWNAIDPNLIIDEDGTPWLSWGSFWSGIKMRRVDLATGKLAEDDPELYALATRFENSRSVEAPFIIHKGDYYYLFVSFDFCCRGFTSTYRVMVGRSETVTGPYIDRDGVPMLEGGGTQVTFPTARWRGPGHNAILQENGEEFIVYHAYDATLNGLPTLRIDRLTWDDDGWPFIEGAGEEADN